jgi:hypothetical protein
MEPSWCPTYDASPHVCFVFWTVTKNMEIRRTPSQNQVTRWAVKTRSIFFFRLLPLCLECEKYPDRFQTFSACHMSHGFSVFSSRFGWHRRVSTKISVNIPQCGAPKIAKLVNITPITMVYGTQITIVTGAYKPTYIWEASHCIIFHASIFHKYSNLIPLYHTTISWIFHSGFFVSASHLMRCWLYWKLYNIYIYITYNYTYCHEYHIIYPLFFPL